MNVITISREYGAGGRTVGRRLAAALGWRLLDRDLLHQVAAIEDVPDEEMLQQDEKAVDVRDRFRLKPSFQKYYHGLLQAVRDDAFQGNVVFVGRGARCVLGCAREFFHLRLVAPVDWRAARIAEIEKCSFHGARARCTEIDRARDRFVHCFFGEGIAEPSKYDLVVNTSRVPFEALVSALTTMVRDSWPAADIHGAPGRRVLSLSRELGTTDSDFTRALAACLGMELFDRALLEQAAIRLGLTEEKVSGIDEQPAGLFQKFLPGSVYRRYFRVLKDLMADLAERGNAIIVGRGGNCFLRHDPCAFHVRLAAVRDVRMLWVMKHLGLEEGPALQAIDDNDGCRWRFIENNFGSDWGSPLEYHITVNTGPVHAVAVPLIAYMAKRHWQSATGKAPVPQTSPHRRNRTAGGA